MSPSRHSAQSTSSTSTLTINVFDGTRQPLATGTNILYRVIDGNHKQQLTEEKEVSSLTVTSLPFYDNFGDNYTAIVFADRYRQAGFTPLKLSPKLPVTADLMIIPKTFRMNFSAATWDIVKTKFPFLASGADDATGKTRYENLMENKPNSLAALLNIITAMSQINLAHGTPLDYLKQVKWDDSLAQDRFFAYCDPKLLDEVKTAAAHGFFAPEVGPGFFHAGATASWKQVQFGEANVQLTFHEGDQNTIGGVGCICVEPDIDYYKDLGGHALLEVIPNALTGGLTNPEVVYVLRWIAGRHAGIAEFDPPYTIEQD